MASHEQENCAQNPRTERKAIICKLNDGLRCHQKGGQVFITRGVLAFGDQVPGILQGVAAYDDFADGNDPHGEHDFGAIIFSGQKIFWKIDYYDNNMQYGSPDPANASVTSRVLTIMLSDEY